MDPFIAARLAGFAAAAVSTVYALVFIARRLRLQAQGRQEEKPAHLLSSRQIDQKSDRRMGRDRASRLFHRLVTVGFIAGILGHVVGALASAPLGQTAHAIVAALSAAAFIGGGAFLVLGSAAALVRRVIGSSPRLTGTAADLLASVSTLLLGLFGILYCMALAADDARLVQLAGSLHMLSAAFFIVCFARTRLLHVLMFFRLKSRGIESDVGTLAPDPGVEKAIARGTTDGIRIGVRGLEDLSARQRVEADACVSCGMCDDVCPARLSGKSLSPRFFTERQKRLMDASMGRRQAKPVFDEDVVQMAMECTACHACETACPMFVGKVDRITGLRRNRLLESGTTLPEWASVLRNCSRSGNVFDMPAEARAELLRTASIPRYSQGMDVDYVLWLGCYGAFDPRSRTTVIALARLLKATGKKLAAFPEETCCGDMARRIGDEYLFRELVEKNAETLATLGDVPLLTICPHCSNSISREYRQLGVAARAVHYTEILPELLSSAAFTGRAKGNGGGNGGYALRAAYHDSCYLARANGIIDQPRKFLAQACPDVTRVSLDAEGADTLCCGGGGGRVAAEEKSAERISGAKIKELRAKGAEVLLTSCPYCLSLFSDSAESEAFGLRVADLLAFASERLERARIEPALRA